MCVSQNNANICNNIILFIYTLYAIRIFSWYVRGHILMTTFNI